MDAIVSLAAALAENANAIEHDIDAIEQSLPVLWRQQTFESNGPPLACAQALRQAGFDAPGPATTDDQLAAGRDQRFGRVPANESRSAEDEYREGPRGRIPGRAAVAIGVHSILL
jgi:hypothetical protein